MTSLFTSMIAADQVSKPTESAKAIHSHDTPVSFLQWGPALVPGPLDSLFRRVLEILGDTWAKGSPMSLGACLPTTIQPSHADLQDVGVHGDPGLLFPGAWHHLWAGLWGSSLATSPSSQDEAYSLVSREGSRRETQISRCGKS